MVERQIVLETIRKMLSAGLEDAVIVDTLKDVGLSEKEIPGFLAEARGKPSVSKPPVPGMPSFEQEPTTPAGFGEPQENALLHTATHAALENSAGQLDEVTRKLDDLARELKTLSSLPVSDLAAKMAAFEKKTSGLSTEMAEVRAQTQALREVLEKVLDTNRNILQELESRK